MWRGTTITSESHTDLVEKQPWLAIKSKRCGLLPEGILLQHDNERCYKARAKVAATTNWKV